MDVWPVVKLVLLDQPLAHVVNPLEIVDSKGVGRAESGHDRGDAAAASNTIRGRSLKRRHVDGVIQMRRDGNHVVLTDPQPGGDRKTTVVALLRDEHDRVVADAGANAAG